MAANEGVIIFAQSVEAELVGEIDETRD